MNAEFIINEFEKDIGEGCLVNMLPDKTLNYYQGKLIGSRDKLDIMHHLLKTKGLRVYSKGLFAFVNPNDYKELLSRFPNLSNESIPFVRTVLGNFFIYTRTSFGQVIVYYNVQTGVETYLGKSFTMFLIMKLSLKSKWMEDCNGKMEYAAVKKFPYLPPDECVTYVPALALGGSERVENMKVVKLKEHLAFLAQLHS